MATISVLLVDDHELVRQGLRRAFEHEPEFVIHGDVATLEDAFQAVQDQLPDVVLLDVRLPDGSGLEAAQRLRTHYPDLGIVILTMYAGDDHLFGALDAGASAFVAKDASADAVLAAARHAASSPQTFAAADLAGAMQRRLTPTGPQLSPREREVLGLLADGLSVSQISKRLYISDSTTKTHVAKLYEKLGAGNRAQALMTALRMGLISAGAHEAGVMI